jgi:hypothetical protein
MTSNLKQPRNLLPSRAYAADLSLGEGFRGFFITQMTEEERKEKRKAYYAQNKDRIKAQAIKWQAENKDKVKTTKAKWIAENAKDYSAKYYAENKEKLKDYAKDYAAKKRKESREAKAKHRLENPDQYIKTTWKQRNPEKAKAHRAKWYEKHKEINKVRYPRTDAMRLAKQVRKKQRKIEDPVYAMAERLRNRLFIVFKLRGFKKQSRTEKMLGCTFKQFTKHIEKQFADGMSWDNRGEWHLDHIIPLSCATTVEGLEKLSRYTNIRPLWAADNLLKSNNLVLI